MNEDTVHLLKECNNGCKMATNSMEQVMSFIKEHSLRTLIENYNRRHIALGEECHVMLNREEEEEKEPTVLAKAFSWVSTEVKLAVNDDSAKIADLMVDGCNMGIKSVSKYKNQYKNASEESKELAERLIKMEQDFMKELLEFL